MKAIMYFLAVMAILFSSCTRPALIVPEAPVQSKLQANIYTTVNEPRTAVLGDPATFFIVGEKVTIYIPYENSYSDIDLATFNLLDESGAVITSLDITGSKNNFDGLNVPASLQGIDFLHATIEMKEEFAGKMLGIQTLVSDGQTISDDYMKYAFNVIY